MTRSALIILPNNPGDVVMGLQAIARWHRLYPSVAFDYVVSEECKSLAENHPLIRKVHVIPRQALREAWSRRDAPETLHQLEAFLAPLESARYDVSLNLFQEKSGALVQGFVAAARKAGMELGRDGVLGVASRMLQYLSAIPAARADNGWHAVDVFIRAGCAELGPPETPGEARIQSANAFHSEQVLPALPRPAAWPAAATDPFVALHPGSAWAGKRWPEKHWSGLAMRLVAAGKKIAFTGSPEEREVMDRILAGMDAEARRSLWDMVGKTNLLGAAWILGHARQVITGDTVAMHLAAAQGVPAICLFGASNPVETGPYGTGHLILQTAPLPRPNLDLHQPHAGLQGLTADAVADFLLLGRLPSAAKVWETAWSPRRDMQVLRDAQGRLHPSQAPAKRLMSVLDDDLFGPATAEPEAPLASQPPQLALPLARHAPPEALRVWQALQNAMALAARENLSALDQADRELGAATDEDLVWEAYRIALNSLPMDDLKRHLLSRSSLLVRALREQARLNDAP